MTYETVRSISAMSGLAIFIVIFAGVVLYAFWPGNRERFEKAARIPFDDEIHPKAGGSDGR